MTAATRWVRSTVYMVVTLGVLAGCGRGFQPRDFANPEALFRGAMQEYERGKMANAILGFERLSLDLSSRDPLLVLTYYYLGLAHERQKEYLLAAQAFARLSDAFPSDTLAPKAILGEARSYQNLWRRPGLDADYGHKALGTLRVLLTAYPESPEAVDATARIVTLEDWLARKDYQTGMHYFRIRKAYDSAIIYFQDVVATYPGTATARLAWIGLLRSYRARNWTEEAQETCEELHRRYSGDADVRELCGPSAAAADPAAASSSAPPDAAMPD